MDEEEEGPSEGLPATSHQIVIKSSLSIALICTARRRVPASASTNQRLEKEDLIQL
jgi:hypothetical protein